MSAGYLFEMELKDAIAVGDDPVLRAIFGTAEAGPVADAIASWARRELGAEIAEALFHETSVGAVAGVRLQDGRRVVIKAHQPRVRRERLLAVQGVLRTLAASGFPCPTPVAGPARLVLGEATAETLLDGGVVRDGHDPVVRRELAVRLQEIAARVEVGPEVEALGRSWFSGLPPEQVWPRPHSPLFDFEATKAGAEEIDAIAAAARAVLRAGKRVVGHFDWRAEHARFEGDRMVAAYDWDSLHVDLEPVAVGAAAHAFCADWSREDLPAAPTPEELRAFVRDYESARGAPFDAAERQTLGGSLTYAIAYTARCGHALGAAETARARAFREILPVVSAEWVR